MTAPQRKLAFAEDRNAVREAVHHRTVAYGPDAKRYHILIANISGRGMMARWETTFTAGDRITVMLPVVGATPAVIRWSLGGRIGCEFDLPIGASEYYEVLAELARDPA